MFVAEISPQSAQYGGLNVDYGVLVKVMPGGAAAKSGMQDYDIVIAIDGNKVTNMAELQKEVFGHNVGDSVAVTVQRGKEKIDITVTLGQLEE
jgi:S1-C subfamily serine protease